MSTRLGRSLLLAALVWLLKSSGAHGAQQRLAFQEFVQDPNRLASFARGVAVMKSRDGAAPASKEYRTSWQYWSAMHHYFGPQSEAGTVASARSRALPWLRHFFDGVPDLTPPSSPPNVAQRVFGGCQHGTDHFLTWHRMYLYYFERVLRAAAGDETLRLPYWDYTAEANVGLPAQLGQPQLNGAVNPLFDARRRSQTVQLNPNATDIDLLLQQTSFATFQDNLENQPHGTVHCTVGAGCQIPLMGAVPSAGTDAVFWMHHANIDRIWQCWLEQGGQVPGGSFRQQAFDFVDEMGTLVTLTVDQLLGPGSPIDYTYDNVSQCRRAAAPPDGLAAFRAGALAAEPEKTTLDSATAVAIDAPVKTLSLEVPRTGAPSDSLKKAFRVDRPAVPGAVELVLEGVTVEATPGVLFDVFLAKRGGAERRYVGTLSFFGAGAVHEHGAAAQGFHRSFDVTEALRALVGPELATDAIDVVFEATTGVADADPDEARAAFNAQAGLKIGKVELRVLR
jgi:hypothetical protein